MWLYFLVPEIIRAAKLCSDCSLEIFLFDVFDHTVEQYSNLLKTKASINKLFLLAVVSHKGSMAGTTQKTQRVMGKNSGGREALKSRGKGTRREAILGGDKIEWYQA